MYRLSAYYAARSLSDIPMDCLVPSLFIIIVYWMSGLRVSAGGVCFEIARVGLAGRGVRAVGCVLHAARAGSIHASLHHPMLLVGWVRPCSALCQYRYYNNFRPVLALRITGAEVFTWWCVRAHGVLQLYACM